MATGVRPGDDGRQFVGLAGRAGVSAAAPIPSKRRHARDQQHQYVSHAAERLRKVRDMDSRCINPPTGHFFVFLGSFIERVLRTLKKQEERQPIVARRIAAAGDPHHINTHVRCRYRNDTVSLDPKVSPEFDGLSSGNGRKGAGSRQTHS